MSGFRIHPLRPVRVTLDRNPYGKGWMLRVQIGPGAGYRWIDFPGYSMSKYAPWYRNLHISGRTLRLGRNVKGHRPTLWRRAWGFHWFTKQANQDLFPGWW